MGFVDVKHHVYLLCSVHEDKRCGQLAGDSVAATDTVIEHLSPFVQEMRTRDVANLQVSCDATTGNLSPFVQEMRTRGVANLQVSGDANNSKPVSRCSVHEDRRTTLHTNEP